MAKLNRDDRGRMQNVSHMMVSVLKKNGVGEFKSKALQPNQIVEMTGEEVEASKDVHQRRESNPFDAGFVKQVPEGEDKHPDAPDLGEHPNMRRFEEMIATDDVAKATAMIRRVRDVSGITKVRRMLTIKDEANDITPTTFKRLDLVADKQQEKIDKENARLSRAYDEKMGR